VPIQGTGDRVPEHRPGAVRGAPLPEPAVCTLDAAPCFNPQYAHPRSHAPDSVFHHVQKFAKDLGDEAVIENKPSMQGRQMSMIIGKAASSST